MVEKSGCRRIVLHFGYFISPEKIAFHFYTTCSRLVQDWVKNLPYHTQNGIDNFFAKLKQYRAIATRYDKRAVNFLGAIYLAASVIWLN